MRSRGRAPEIPEAGNVGCQQRVGRENVVDHRDRRGGMAGKRTGGGGKLNGNAVGGELTLGEVPAPFRTSRFHQAKA